MYALLFRVALTSLTIYPVADPAGRPVAIALDTVSHGGLHIPRFGAHGGSSLTERS